MNSLVRDLHFSLRYLQRHRLFSLMAVLTLVLGIGPTTAIFNLLNAVMLRQLPVQTPRELILLGRGRPMGIDVGFPNGNTELFSYPFYRRLHRESAVFSGVAAMQSLPNEVSAAVEGGIVSEPVSARLVSGTYFPVLGINPYRGRLLTDSDDQSVGAHPVAVASYSWWQERFSGDPKIIGKKVTIGSTVFTIIGVTPPNFFGTSVGESPSLWVPLAMQGQIQPGMNGFNDPSFRSLYIVGRLKPGMTIPQANANTNLLFRQSLRESLGSAPDPARLQDIQHAYVELTSMATGVSRLRFQISLPLRILMGAVAFVLLITCANISSLLLAKAASREKEVSIRTAVGASRLQLIRQLLTESVLLCLVAGCLGIALAWWLSRVLVSMVSAGIGAVSLDVHVDSTLLSFALAVSLGTALLVGLVPAMRSTRVDVASSMKEGKRLRIGAKRNALGRILVCAQVALSVVLLAGAALLLRSLVNLTRVHPGFNVGSTLVFHLDPSVLGHPPRSAAIDNLYDELERRVAAVPGVQAASFSMLTFGEGEWDVPASVAGYVPRSSNDSIIHNNIVGPSFFSALGMNLLGGRSFDSTDSASSNDVAVINDTMRKRFFGQESPVGKHFAMGNPGRTRDVEVIGIVGDAKLESLDEPPMPAAYFPYTQYQSYGGGSGYLYDFVVRYSGDAESVAKDVREAIGSVNRNLPINDVTTLAEQVSRSLVPQSIISRFSIFFGLLAAFLACVGIYGLMSFVVSNQTREIGIRIALGARRGTVQWMVIRDLLTLLAVGVAIGVPVALAASRFVSSMLFGLTPSDPLSIVTAVGLMSIAAALAGYIPARRAAKVDPMVALRYE